MILVKVLLKSDTHHQKKLPPPCQQQQVMAQSSSWGCSPPADEVVQFWAAQSDSCCSGPGSPLQEVTVLSAALLEAAAAGVKPHGAHGVRHITCKVQSTAQCILTGGRSATSAFLCSDSDNKMMCMLLWDVGTDLLVVCKSPTSSTEEKSKWEVGRLISQGKRW